MSYKVPKDLIFEKKVKKVTIFDTGKSTIYELNDLGSFIFKELLKGKNEEKIAEIIMKNYKINKTELANDISNFI
ncbi:MAG: hypothetical protein ACD_12C00344G0002, partial [uncultured bacterium]